MFLLFGSTITPSAAHASTAARICAVDGFIDCPSGHDLLDTQAHEKPLHAVTDGHCDDAGRDLHIGGRRLLADPCLFLTILDLLEEVRHPDLRRFADVDPRFDGGADVVGVHVAIPDAVATHDHDRVAQRAPRRLECGRCGRRRRAGST